jgi:hypothetical protein
MIRIHELAYVDDDIKEKWDKIQDAIDDDKIPIFLYYITLASNKFEQLDIISGIMMDSEERNAEDIVIVGVAKDKNSAFKLVEKMARDSYMETGSCSLRKMFI